LSASPSVGQQQGSQSTAPAQPARETYLKLADEVETALHSEVLDMWFPRTVDHEHGGFHSHFGRDWSMEPSDGKFSAFRAE
jgi:mannobiose 2-epimerase